MKRYAGVIEVYDDFFSDGQAEEIIKSAETLHNSDLSYGFKDATIGKGHKGGEVRSNLLLNISEIAYSPSETREYREAVKTGQEKLLLDFKNIQNMLLDKMQGYVNDYTKRYEFPILFDEGYQLLKYGNGQQYKGHSDYAPHIPRYLSALILLNPQDYEGGGTYFHHFEQMIKPDKPALVLFPSNYAYTHQAMPVVSGNKYAIVTWLGHPMDFKDMPDIYKQETPK